MTAPATIKTNGITAARVFRVICVLLHQAVSVAFTATLRFCVTRRPFRKSVSSWYNPSPSAQAFSSELLCRGLTGRGNR
jgi:hypothetical protein